MATEWLFEILKGNLTHDATQFSNPFEFIKNANLNVKLTKNPPLDYAAIHTPTQIAITQLWGLRYNDQQDAFAIGFLPIFEEILFENKINYLKNSIKLLEEKITRKIPHDALISGSTVCVVIHDHSIIYTITLGDSVAFLYDGAIKKLTSLNTYLHSATNPKEITRINDFLINNNFIENDRNIILQSLKNSADPRLLNLALTGAIGDNDYQQFGLTHEPLVNCVSMINSDQLYIIVASDGITEVLDPLDIENGLASLKQLDAKKISHIIAQTAIETGSTDNITVLTKKISIQDPITYLAIFDGHGGNKVSHLCANYLDNCLNNV